jgi:hypothetical protein
MAAAQGVTGNLDGKVTDDTDSALPGVTVTLTGQSMMGTKTDITSEDGAYRFPAIPPGIYSLTYDLSGFQQVTREGVRVELGATATVDVKLGLATLEESITVRGESPSVDVRNTNVSTTFTTQMLETLPNSRQLTGMLAQTPGVQSAVVEVGASNLAAYTAPRVYGVAGRQQFNLDGVDITQGTGHVGTYPDYTSWEEVQVSTSANGAEARTPGMLTNTVIKSGGNNFHGSLFADFQDDSFESDNSSPELVARGLRRGTVLARYWETAGDVGGPIVRDRLWFYTGLRRQRYSSFPAGYFEPGSSEPVSTYIQMDGFTVKGTYKLSENNTLSSFVQRTVKHVPQNNSGAGVPPESTINWRVYGIPWKVSLSSVLGNSRLLEAGVYVHYQDWTTAANSTLPRRFDLTSGWRAGGFSNPNAANDFGNYRRLGTRPQYRMRFQQSLSSHEMKFGVEHVPYIEQLSQKTEDITHIYRGGTTPTGVPVLSPEALARRFGAPSEVLIENTPVTFKDGLNTTSMFAQDTWVASDRVTLNLGVRMDITEAYFPEQDAPARPWAPAESFPEVRDVVSWTSLAPRLGVAYSLTADKRTVVKVNYGQYYESLEPSTFDRVNMNGWRRSRYLWTDRNNSGYFVNPDGTIDAGEVDLNNPFQVTGGSSTTIDPDLKQPRMDEIAISFDRELYSDLAFRFDYNYRTLKNNLGLVNQFQTADQFTIPVTVIDPGLDGLYSTGDDVPVQAYNLNPALVGGQFVRNYLTSPADFDQTYNSYSVSLDRRLRNNWQLRAAFTVSQIDELIKGGGGATASATLDNYPRNPNEARYPRTDWLSWNGRIMGSYMLPRGVQLSGVLRMQSGDQFGRRFTTRNRELNYGTQTIWAEPQNANRLDNLFLTDLRAEKVFSLGTGTRLGLMFDAFNVFNSAAIRSVNTASGASYLRVSSVINPRIVKIGVRLTY